MGRGQWTRQMTSQLSKAKLHDSASAMISNTRSRAEAITPAIESPVPNV